MNVYEDVSELTQRLDALTDRLHRMEENTSLDPEQRERAVALRAQCDILKKRLASDGPGVGHPIREGLHDDWVALKGAFEAWSAGLDARFRTKERSGLS